jgi:hypothetical protein
VGGDRRRSPLPIFPRQGGRGYIELHIALVIKQQCMEDGAFSLASYSPRG